MHGLRDLQKVLSVISSASMHNCNVTVSSIVGAAELTFKLGRTPVGGSGAFKL